jgi:hypothetical protein
MCPTSCTRLRRPRLCRNPAATSTVRSADANQFLTIIDRHSERLSRDRRSSRPIGSGIRRKMTFKPVEAGQLVQRVLRFRDRAAKRKVSPRIHFPFGLLLILATMIACNSCSLTSSITRSNASRGIGHDRATHAHLGSQADAGRNCSRRYRCRNCRKDLPRSPNASTVSIKPAPENWAALG